MTESCILSLDVNATSVSSTAYLLWIVGYNPDTSPTKILTSVWCLLIEPTDSIDNIPTFRRIGHLISEPWIGRSFLRIASEDKPLPTGDNFFTNPERMKLRLV